MASSTSVVRNTLDVVRPLIGVRCAEAQFADLRSGSGKTIFVYLFYTRSLRQKKTAAVLEYDPELNRLANGNGRCFEGYDFKFVQGSALNLKKHVGESEFLFVYLYNPLQRDVAAGP